MTGQVRPLEKDIYIYTAPSMKYWAIGRCGRSCSIGLTKAQGINRLKVSQTSSQGQQHTLIHQGQDLRRLMGSEADTLAGENCIR